MSVVVIRNPPGRWGMWLGIALVLFVLPLFVGSDSCDSSGTTSCTSSSNAPSFMWISWAFALGFALAAFFSFRARLTLDANGIRVKGVWANRTYPWDDVLDIKITKVRRYTNGIRTGTERKLEILVRSRSGWQEMPAPKAGLLIGKAEFDRQTELFWQIWRAQRAQVSRG